MLGAVARRASSCVALIRCLRPVHGPVLGPVLPRISACHQHTAPRQSPQKRWALSVSPYTCVRAELASCNLSISPLDPHAFPESDQAFITVHGVSAGQEAALDHCHVLYDEERRELRITGGDGDSNLSIDLEAPVQSNLLISCAGSGHVHISKMECDICKVSTQEGNCTLHSVKSHHVEVRSSGGCVTGLGTIHGNVDIVSTGQSSVDVKKLQGTTMNVSTEHGSLKVKAIYAESSSIASCTGTVQLGHVHGNATVKNESGDTVIDGSNSAMQVSSHTGDIDLYVGDGGSADVFSDQGSVRLRVPSTLKAAVDLCGASVDISPEVVLHGAETREAPDQTNVTGFLNGESHLEQPHLKAHTKTGSVRLKAQSWFESLKLS
ncbi:unnamed protein product [Knipowitschia caucasica]|uniref:DUF4097 domain-containing protein n=1 Tax=Knipowitschia caucasica TaxID=637954 RepID=A0AAV2KYA5_KNICA